MSLSERVKAAEGVHARSLGCASTSLTVDELRRDVKEWTSLEAIAAIMVDNPQRARNELRSSCRHALSEPKWAALSGAEKRKITDELIDVVFGMGPIESLIDDESVTEIMINGSESIFFERGGKLVKSGLRFESDEQVRVLIDRIISPLGRRIDESSPMVNARLSAGHRVNAVIPPIAPDGPHLTIRAFTRHAMTLEEMSSKGSMDSTMRSFIGWIVRSHKNVVVSGGTGSGKTTLLNAMSYLISADERIITIEDSAELKIGKGHHVVRMEARPRNAEGEGEITIRSLVINSLRMRPDRIIVGECRGGEALDMLQAMNTGHDGSLTTLHANAPEDVVDRMITMVRYAVDLPVGAIESQIGSAFDYIIQLTRDTDGNRFLSVVAEVAYNRALGACEIERVFVRDHFDEAGTWLKCPKVVDEMKDAGRRDAVMLKEVQAWVDQVFMHA